VVRDEEQLLKIPGGSGGLQLTLAGDHIVASSVVHVLGVLLTSDMSMDKHAAAVSAKCFFPVAAAAPYTSFTRRQRRRYARPCLCWESRGLLW